DLGHRTAAESENRCAASHGFDHGEAERLRPVDGKQQRLCVAEEVRLLMLVDLSDEFDAGSVKQRLDLRPEIGLVGAVDLGRDLQRDAERPGYHDGTVWTLFRRDAAEKGDIVAGRLRGGA